MILLTVSLLLCGCGETKTVTCDGCGKSIEIDADSNANDDWIIYCKTCERSFFDEDGLLSGN